MTTNAEDRWADDGGPPPVWDFAVASGDLDLLGVAGPNPDEMAAERARRDRDFRDRTMAKPKPELAGPKAERIDGSEAITARSLTTARDPYPEFEDRGLAQLSPMGSVEYVQNLIKPGRLLLIAAEEGTGKTYAAKELAVRMAVAGGAFAETWPVEVCGPVACLSEMSGDDDWLYEERVLEALDVPRAALVGRLYGRDMGTAADGKPPLADKRWRDQFTRWAIRKGLRLAIIDTATTATRIESWGPQMQDLMAQLRAILAAAPELALVLVVHLKKPQGRGGRRISDVQGEWGRWCDVLLLMEDAGGDRTRLTTRKRVVTPRTILARREDGLLVDPQDVAELARATKVPSEKVLAAIPDEGISYAALGAALEVSKLTAARYVAALGDAVVVVTGANPSPTLVYRRDAVAPPLPHHRITPHQEASDAVLMRSGTTAPLTNRITASPPRRGDAVGDAAGTASDDVDLDLAELATDDDGEVPGQLRAWELTP